jgi:hypothetical protein
MQASGARKVAFQAFRGRGGHVRRLLAEALEAAGHTVRDLPEHD